MVSVGISEFRANLSMILQRVQRGEIISIRQRGAEVARLVPPDFAQLSARKELAILRETAAVGDVLSPIDEVWTASQ
jgi:prevent-host-death family protein